MPTPLVSVVMPCYNASRWIAKSLESIERQGIADTEIIVVDDGSTDGSLDIVRTQFPQVRTVEISHQGPSVARNAGTAIASGEFIQYLDADDRLAAGKWRDQLKTLQRHEADVAYGDWQKCDEDGALLTGPEARVTRRLGARPELDVISDFWCPPAVYLYRRRVVTAVGGWNEGLRLIEDVRFVMDSVLKGARFVYTPGVAAFYRVHADSVTMRGSEVFMQCCLANDIALENELKKRGSLDGTARAVLQKNYLEIARNSCQRFPSVFEEACAGLERLSPHFVPSAPLSLAWASRLLGYRRAEALACNVRRLKSR